MSKPSGSDFLWVQGPDESGGSWQKGILSRLRDNKWKWNKDIDSETKMEAMENKNKRQEFGGNWRYGHGDLCWLFWSPCYFFFLKFPNYLRVLSICPRLRNPKITKTVMLIKRSTHKWLSSYIRISKPLLKEKKTHVTDPPVHRKPADLHALCRSLELCPGQ